MSERDLDAVVIVEFGRARLEFAAISIEVRMPSPDPAQSFSA